MTNVSPPPAMMAPCKYGKLHRSFKVFEKSRVSDGFREIRHSPGFFQKL
jgi:hypothetical protein